MNATDAQLIACVIGADDRSAFGQLVHRHQSAVRHFLRHLSGDAALADELAQETFLSAYRSLRLFRHECAFSTWLLGIARNHWRNAARRRRTIPLEPHHLEGQDTGESAARTSDLQHDLALALRALSEDERTALHLTYQQGLSHSEISTLLGWPIGTVKTHLARAKDKLRPLLSPWNEKIST